MPVGGQNRLFESDRPSPVGGRGREDVVRDGVEGEFRRLLLSFETLLRRAVLGSRSEGACEELFFFDLIGIEDGDGNADAILRGLVFSLVIAAGTALLVRLGRQLVERYVEDPARRYNLSKMVGRTMALLAFILIIAVWSPGLKNLITILTVIGAGLAIAMREVLLSFVGWLDLVFRSPYEQGDRVEIGPTTGDVVDIRVLHTTLMETGGWVDADQSTGRLVHVPNAWIFQHPVYNYTHGFNFIWNEIMLTVTFRSDWEAAREIMVSKAQETSQIVEQQVKQQIRQMSREYLVHYSILTPFVYVRIVENGIRLTLRYLCEVRKRRGTEHALTVSILQDLRAHGGIELAYPALHVQQLEAPQFAPVPDAYDESVGPDRS